MLTWGYSQPAVGIAQEWRSDRAYLDYLGPFKWQPVMNRSTGNLMICARPNQKDIDEKKLWRCA
jgi:hypothetical protein